MRTEHSGDQDKEGQQQQGGDLSLPQLRVSGVISHAGGRGGSYLSSLML
jgi:hypothetical protein